MNEKKIRVNKYPLAASSWLRPATAGRFRSREYSMNRNTRVVGYPSDHRVEQPKGLTKFIRNWLF